MRIATGETVTPFPPRALALALALMLAPATAPAASSHAAMRKAGRENPARALVDLLEVAKKGVPTPAQINTAMRRLLRQLNAQTPSARALVEDGLARQRGLMKSIVETMGRGEGADGAPLEVFSGTRDLRNHYLETTTRKDVHIFYPGTVLGVNPLSDAETAQLPFGDFVEVPALRRRSRSYGTQYLSLAGNARTPYAFSYGFLRGRSRDRRRVARPFMMLAREPWAAAAKHAPALLDLLRGVADRVTHDFTQHQLYYSANRMTLGGEAWWNTFADYTHDNNYERSAMLGHFFIMQDAFERDPTYKAKVLGEAAEFVRLADTMADQQTRELYDAKVAAGQAGPAVRAAAAREARAQADYFVDVYFKKNLFYIMDPRRTPELAKVVAAHPFLDEGRAFQRSIWELAANAKMIGSFHSHADLMARYRAYVNGDGAPYRSK